MSLQEVRFMFIDNNLSVSERYRTRVPDSPTATEALLDLIGPVDDVHVLLIGPGGLDMMCGLIDEGCASVEMVSLGQRHRSDFSEIVIVPNIGCSAVSREAITQARRMMRPLNSLILRFAMCDATAALVQEARDLLTCEGFSAIRAFHLSDGTVLTAELPLCGQVASL
jgi:hypothetical protein